MAYEEEEKTRSGLTKRKKAASESENPDTEAAFQQKKSRYPMPHPKHPIAGPKLHQVGG